MSSETQSKIDELKKKNSEATLQLKDFKTKYDELEFQYQQAAKKYEEEKKYRQRAEEDLKETEKERDEIKRKLDNERKKPSGESSSQASQIKELEDKIAELKEAKKQEKRKAEEDKRKLDEAATKMLELVEERSTLKKEVEALKSKLEDQKKNHDKQLKDYKLRLDEHNSEKDQLAEDRRKMEEKGLSGMVMKEKLEAELNDVKAKLEAKKQKTKEIKEEKEKLEEEVDSWKKKFKRQNTVILDFDETKERFDRTIQELKNKLKEESSNNAQLQEKLEALTRENESVKARYEKAEKEKTKAKEEKQSLKQSERDLQVKVEDLSDKLQEKERELQKWSDLKRGLDKEIETLKNSKGTENTSVLKAEIEGLKSQYESEKNNSERIQQELQTKIEEHKQNVNQIESLKEQLEKANAERQTYKEKLQLEENSTERRVAEFHNTTKQLEAEIERLQKELEEARNQKPAVDVTIEYERLKSRFDEKKAKKKQLKSQYEAQSLELRNLKAEVEAKRKLEQELASAKKAAEEAKKINTQIEAKMKVLERQNAEMESTQVEELTRQLQLQRNETMRLLTDLKAVKPKSNMDVDVEVALAILVEKIRKRITPGEVERVNSDNNSLVNASSSTQRKVEVEIDKQMQGRVVKKSSLSSIQREVLHLRTERRKLKKQKREFIEECNKLSEIFVERTKLETLLLTWRKRLSNHAKNKVPLGKTDEEISSVLAECNRQLRAHDQVEKEQSLAWSSRDAVAARLREHTFLVTRMLQTPGFGMTDSSAEVLELKSSLEKERKARIQMEEQLKKGGKKSINHFVEVFIENRAQLFQGAVDTSHAPKQVTRTIEFLEHKLGTEDMFGKDNYKIEKVNQIKEYFDKGHDIDVQKCGDVYIVAELLKAYFRDLPEPILTNNLRDRFVSGADLSDDSRNGVLKESLQYLPKENRDVLAILFEFLGKLVSKSSTNQTTPEKLALVFGPLLYGKD